MATRRRVWRGVRGSEVMTVMRALSRVASEGGVTVGMTGACLPGVMVVALQRMAMPGSVV